jgi:hypothetical protein
MHKTTKAYWLATGFLALILGVGGVVDVVQPEPLVDVFQHLGYPMYVATLLGVCKELAALALLVPGLPRLKEWAYAGICFDLGGAAISHALCGDAAVVALLLALLALALVSCALRPNDRKMEPQPLVVRERVSMRIEV